MKLTNKPTQITTLKTFQDKKGNEYELRGQRNMYSEGDCFKTNYYELYKKDRKSYSFEKIGAKEELYLDSYYGYKPSTIRKETVKNGKTVEETKIFKTLNGYDIECRGESLSMNKPIRVLHAKDQFDVQKTKIQLSDTLNINGQKRLSNMAKRILKLLKNV